MHRPDNVDWAVRWWWALGVTLVVMLAPGCKAQQTQALGSGFVDDGNQATSNDTGSNRDGQDNAADAPASDSTEEDLQAADGPDMPQYSGDSCPTLTGGRNTLQVLDQQRSLLLYLPPEPQGAPVLLLWHWLGGSASAAAQTFGAQEIATSRGWIVAVPDSCCASQSEWGFPPSSQATQQDLTLFDDMLACLDEQYSVDRTRIYTSGFSAGSLWSSYLILERSEYLAAAAIFSGGIGLFPYQKPQRTTPVLLVDGGPGDVYGGVVNFETMTEDFAQRLTQDGHFVMRCSHTRGHRLPQGATSWGFDFLSTHSYAQSQSPLLGSDPVSRGYPNWCEIR